MRVVALSDWNMGLTDTSFRCSAQRDAMTGDNASLRSNMGGMHDELLIASKGTTHDTGKKSLKHSPYERVEQTTALAVGMKLIKLGAEGRSGKAA